MSPSNGAPPPVVQQIIITLTADGQTAVQITNPQIDPGVCLAMLGAGGVHLANYAAAQAVTKPQIFTADQLPPGMPR